MIARILTLIALVFCFACGSSDGDSRPQHPHGFNGPYAIGDSQPFTVKVGQCTGIDSALPNKISVQTEPTSLSPYVVIRVEQVGNPSVYADISEYVDLSTFPNGADDVAKRICKKIY